MQGKWLLSSQLCSTLNHTVWSGCISSPTGSCAKAYIWQAFKPRLQNMCWRKWFKILRKQSFILESLFTWDNKPLPRIGSIHQENTTTEHTLAGACLSAIMLPWLLFIICGASQMDKQAGHTSMGTAALSGAENPPPPRRSTRSTDDLTDPTGLPALSYRATREQAAGIQAHEGDVRQEHLGARSRSSTSPLKR